MRLKLLISITNLFVASILDDDERLKLRIVERLALAEVQREQDTSSMMEEGKYEIFEQMKSRHVP